MTILWTSGARSDLIAIFDYIANDNPAAAAALVDRVNEAVMRLEDHPGLGRPGRRAGTRELVIAGSSYIAVYRIRRDTVQVLRVLHGAQKWP